MLSIALTIQDVRDDKMETRHIAGTGEEILTHLSKLIEEDNYIIHALDILPA